MNKDKKVVAIGHNQMPNDCQGKCPWNKNPNEAKNAEDQSMLDYKTVFGEIHNPCSFT